MENQDWATGPSRAAGPWAVGPWAVGRGPWAVGRGPWAVGRGPLGLRAAGPLGLRAAGPLGRGGPWAAGLLLAKSFCKSRKIRTGPPSYHGSPGRGGPWAAGPWRAVGRWAVGRWAAGLLLAKPVLKFMLESILENV